jgi:hypothetical protein
MSKDNKKNENPHYNPIPTAPVNQQFNDIMNKFNACVKNCEPFRQDMTKMAVCVNTCSNIWNSYVINK